jgi:hypothetical protein
LYPLFFTQAEEGTWLTNTKNPMISPAGKMLLTKAIKTSISKYTIGIELLRRARIITGSQQSTRYGAARMDRNRFRETAPS